MSFDQVVQSWDTANKPSELADFSVCVTIGKKGSKLYVLSVFRRKLDFPSLKRAVVDQAELFNPSIILIEDRASGAQIIQDLLAAGESRVTRYSPEGDKIMRLHAQTATMENGFVYLPTQAPWLDEFLRELTVFPNSRHDDQVDAIAQALDWIKTRSASPGIIEYYRLECERLELVSTDLVRLNAPKDISGAYGLGGRYYATRDGCIDVEASDIPAFLAAGFIKR